MMKMRFRIIKNTKNDRTVYETKVKSWIGWISFTVFYKTDLVHIFSDPSDDKAVAYDRIYQYCKIKGYKKEDIEINEINKE